jgi:hypothetical protein
MLVLAFHTAFRHYGTCRLYIKSGAVQAVGTRFLSAGAMCGVICIVAQLISIADRSHHKQVLKYLH